MACSHIRVMKKSFFYRPKPKQSNAEKPKRWRPLSILWNALKRTCMLIGAMILLSAAITTCTLMTVDTGAQKAASMPDNAVLVFKIEEGITEIQTQPNLFEPFPFTQPTIRQITDKIYQAQFDPRVKGLVFSLKGGSVNLTHVEEIREAITAFKESGKPAKIFAPSYDGGSIGIVQYYLASVFDEIWMQPVGMVSLSGVNFEMPFAREALDKIGVRPEFFKRAEYKSAVENLTNTTISPENREMMTSIMKDYTNLIVEDVAKDRGIDKQKLEALFDKAILSGREALEAGIIDRLDYADKILPEMQKTASNGSMSKKLELYDFASYQGKKVTSAAKNNAVALIYVTGTIAEGNGPRARDGASQIAQTINDAAEDKSIDAIVVRIDSPGGSPTASETIRRALEKARNSGKKVVISMGPVAASGGYWIASESDKVYASNSTLTGSIGVVMGKFELSDLWDKIGVNWQGPQSGENTDIWSMNKPLDAAEIARMNALIDATYEDFLKRVSSGRNLSMDYTSQIAKGRAYTGIQAEELGLVDELGGLNSALDGAAQILGLQDRHNINVVKMPRDLTGIEKVFELLGQEVSINQFMPVVLGKNNNVTSNINRYADEIHLFTHGSPIAVYDPMLANMSSSMNAH